MNDSLEKANGWLQRAKSNMARAKAGRVSTDILYEDLCYDDAMYSFFQALLKIIDL